MDDNYNIIDKLPQIRGSYRQNASLAKTNWFNIGGPAQILFKPQDIEDLCHFLKEVSEDINVTILGVGSNLLVRDKGIDGVVIKLGREFTNLSISDNIITAGAGALCLNASTFAANNNLSGLEFLVGIPGTIGGALFMNAGAYGSDTASILKEAKLVDEKGEINILKPDDIGYIYRGNSLPKNMIFVEGKFYAKPGNKGSIEKIMQEISEKRQETQPIKSRTSGSTFKNPPEQSAWKLIDEAGCRGLKIGDAQVSEKHCNFFINTGQATAKDVEDLGIEVKKRVKEKTGIDLEWEVKIIGKNSYDKSKIR